MKVLWFTNTPAAAFSDKSKGTGGWIESLDKAIQEKTELHVAFLYPYKRAPFKKDKTTYYPIYTGNIVLESIKNRLFPNRKKKYTADYLDVINKVKPEIIHIHGSENTFHEIIDKVNIPIVLSIQGNLTIIAHKYKAGFLGVGMKIKRGKFSWKSLILSRTSFSSEHTWMQQMSKIEQRNLRHLKYVIGRTDWDYRISRVFSPKSQYYVVNESLRDPFYRCNWKNTEPNEKIIIHTTSGDTYYKGFETICTSLSLLNNLGYQVEWRVAGVSKESTVNEIAHKVLRDNYPVQGLNLLGSLNADELALSLSECDIYVMPSHIENSPNNLCEAMIMGVPCIATHAGGTASILKDKEEGLIIQDGDPWVLAGAIIELINNPDKAKLYGQNAQKTALKRHNQYDIVQSLLNAYQDIIENNK